ncbi:hypothetical protein J7L67_07200 [bacterium]|nr:hypothetical protein [bacterium]
MRNFAKFISILFIFLSIFSPQTSSANTTSEVYITCSIASFGGYKLKGVISAIANKAGLNEIGYIVVDGACNEPYPWILRVYTDNKNYLQTAGAIKTQEIPQGMIREGGGSVPLQFKSPNTGEEWVYIPDINNPNYTSYYAVRDLGAGAQLPETLIRESVICGLDPRNASWVAGHDGILFTDDDNDYGDITIPTPFKIQLAVRLPKGLRETVRTPYGKYSTKLIFEIISEP